MWWYELFGFLLRFHWISAICFIIGFILIILEMFTPGFGVAGVSGIILLVLGIMFTARNFLEAIVMIAIVLIIAGVLLAIFFRLASKGKLNNKIILVDKMNKEAGFVGRSEPQSFLGKEGVAVTMLRPSGTINIDGTKLDVVAEGEFIPRGTRVKVIKVEGIRIIVKKAE
ncbi:MAG: hypothetical protein GX754_12375 [Clostridiaceae bacterium]|nr:hypothetical protein [Clostridiaceae bacterium]